MCSACTGDYENPDLMADDELEETEDRLHLALAAAYSTLRVTTSQSIQERRDVE